VALPKRVPAGRQRQEAVALFERERAPLTITDLKMPSMDGLELLRQVRDRDSEAAVIMLTGPADVAMFLSLPLAVLEETRAACLPRSDA
jgi:FixJ family two-component response regulator